MIVYMMRHGETDWNTQHKLQGWTDIPLNAKGRREAELTREGLRGVKFDAAFASPLSRARETTEIILKGQDAEVIVDDRLKEVRFGAFEGSDTHNLPKELEVFFTQPEKYVATNGAESHEQVLERVSSFWNELCANPKYQDSNILVTTHGGTIRRFLHAIQGNADCSKNSIHKNCGMTIVEVKDGKTEFLKEAVILYNENEL